MHYPLVTLIGGAGFVGRHTVKLFTEKGWRVQVLCRDTVAAEFLKTAGYPGQVVLDYADITKPGTLEGKFAGSDAVVNLASTFVERGRQNFQNVYVNGARALAEQAARTGAKAFVQISALSAERGGSRYAKAKLAGEAAVREAFPAATVLRPSLIIGPEDEYLQRFARMSMVAPALPIIGQRTKLQPVLVTDVALAIYQVATHEHLAGKTYELAGDQVYMQRELMELMLRIIKRPKPLIALPFAVASLLGMVCDLLPLPPMLTRDQVRMLRQDNVSSAGALSWRELGLAPQSVEAALPELLARYVAG